MGPERAELAAKLAKGVRGRKEELIGLRHDLHQCPEPGHHEERTAALVRSALGSHDFVVGTTTVVELAPDRTDTVVLRAELDGLEISEEPRLDWSSETGWMHACGHDIDTAALVGLVAAMRDFEDQLPVGITAVFQSAEEVYPSGARLLLDDHDFPARTPVGSVAVHVHPHIAAGSLGVGSGPVNASADEFCIEIEGQGGHGAYPQLTKDPVLAMSAVVLALQQIASRRIDPLQPVVVSVGAAAAGSAPNAIPGVATIRGTTRAFSEAARQRVNGLVEEVATAVAAGYDCVANVEVSSGEPVLSNDPALAQGFERVAASLGLSTAAFDPTMGADDFAYFAELGPTLMVFAGAPSMFGEVGLHHRDYVPADDVVELVAMGQLCGYLAAIGPARCD